MDKIFLVQNAIMIHSTYIHSSCSSSFTSKTKTNFSSSLKILFQKHPFWLVFKKLQIPSRPNPIFHRALLAQKIAVPNFLLLLSIKTSSLTKRQSPKQLLLSGNQAKNIFTIFFPIFALSLSKKRQSNKTIALGIG